MSENTSSAKDAPEPGWIDWATRTTAILAVVAALSSGRWGASNLQAILEQGKVNDTWSYYQAESIKQHGADQMSDLVKAMGSDQAAERTAAFEALQKKYYAEARAKEKDKKLRQADALRFQRRRDAMVERGFWFEISFTALQLGVVLCTVATGAKRKGPWLGAMFFGALGLVLLVNGFYTVVHAPASLYQGSSQEMGYQATPATQPQ